MSTRFGLRTVENSIENPHFIFCSSFQNLRLGGVILPLYKRTNPKNKPTHRHRVIACVCIGVNPSCKYFTPIQTHHCQQCCDHSPYRYGHEHVHPLVSTEISCYHLVFSTDTCERPFTRLMRCSSTVLKSVCMHALQHGGPIMKASMRVRQTHHT